jgi:hypothetical protein
MISTPVRTSTAELPRFERAPHEPLHGSSSLFVSVYLQVDPPFPHDDLWDHTQAGPAICPLDHLRSLCGICAKAARVWCDADPAEVQAVGIPAGLDGDVGVCPLMGVPGTRAVEKPECRVGEVKQGTAQFQCVSGRAWSVIGVRALTDPLRVVDDREKLHDVDVGTVSPANQIPFSNTLAQWATL